MKNRTRTSKFDATAPDAMQHQAHGRRPMGADFQDSVRQIQKRYGTLALTMALIMGSVLMLLGQRPLGKGLILGAVFSVLNFIVMAAFMPLQIAHHRPKATLFSLGSVAGRYALLAIPLVWAFKQPQFAVSTVAAGLFMVQLVILGDQVWRWLRNPLKGK